MAPLWRAPPPRDSILCETVTKLLSKILFNPGLLPVPLPLQQFHHFTLRKNQQYLEKLPLCFICKETTGWMEHDDEYIGSDRIFKWIPSKFHLKISRNDGHFPKAEDRNLSSLSARLIPRNILEICERLFHSERCEKVIGEVSKKERIFLVRRAETYRTEALKILQYEIRERIYDGS